MRRPERLDVTMEQRGSTRLAWLRPEQHDQEQHSVFDAIVNGERKGAKLTDEAGRMRGPFNAMLFAPRIGNPLQDLGAAIRFRSSLSPRIREAACLVVASHARCEFEQRAHRRIGLEAGLTESEAADLEAEQVPSSFASDEAAAMEVVSTVLAGRDVSDDDYGRLASVLDESALVELVALVGYYRLLADLMRVFGVPNSD